MGWGRFQRPPGPHNQSHGSANGPPHSRSPGLQGPSGHSQPSLLRESSLPPWPGTGVQEPAVGHTSWPHGPLLPPGSLLLERDSGLTHLPPEGRSARGRLHLRPSGQSRESARARPFGTHC